jgi:aminopeptidase N
MPREFALPGARPRYAPDRQFDVKHIRIDLDIDVDAKRIEGTCALTISPIAPGLQRLQLDAVELEIAQVTCGGKRLEHGHDGKVLTVNLGPPRQPEDELVIEIAYSGNPRRGLYFVGPDDGYPDKPKQVWSQGQDEDSRCWFPCFDAPHEKSTSEVRVTVPATWFALSNGTLIEDVTSGDRRTLHWRFLHEHSAYLISLAAGEFTEIRDRWDGIDVAYYVIPGREEHARRTLGRTPEMLELFSRVFRMRYPYEKYAQVFVADFIFGGMENTTATTLADLFLLDERATLDHDNEALVAHELAHQWFGDLLTCRSWSEGWLNEGFATYAEYIWREHAEGRDAAALELEVWADAYFSEDSRRYRRTLTTNFYDEPIDVFDHHLYEKGGLVLHMLRRVLGDEPFYKSIGHYLTKHRLGSVETRDLTRAIEEATGRVLDWFFDQWITQGAGHPELEVRYSWDADSKLACLTIRQTQKVDRSTPLFRLPTQVRFRVGTQDRDFEFDVSEAQHTFYFSLEREPTQAIFDPGRHLLARVKTQKPYPLWLDELEHASEASDRSWAARELGRRGEVRATFALVRALREDRFWGVRAAAAAALGELRTDNARDALIAALPTTKEPRARRAVVRALGDFRHDSRAGTALAAHIARGDESYFVEAEACLSLGRTRSSQAPGVLRQALDRDSFLDIIRQHAYRGLAEARDESALPLLLDAIGYGKSSHGRRAAASALARMVRGRRDRFETEARERIEELLWDPDFRMQGAAIEALAVIGDPGAIAELERLVRRDLDGRLRRRAREVIRDLEEGRAHEEQISALRDQLERARDELAQLRERIDRVETGRRAVAPSTRRPSVRRKGGGKKTVP